MILSEALVWSGDESGDFGCVFNQWSFAYHLHIIYMWLGAHLHVIWIMNFRRRPIKVAKWRRNADSSGVLSCGRRRRRRQERRQRRQRRRRRWERRQLQRPRRRPRPRSLRPVWSPLTPWKCLWWLMWRPSRSPWRHLAAHSASTCNFSPSRPSPFPPPHFPLPLSTQSAS